jgi:spermidine synthase
MDSIKTKRRALFAALFATGLSGIVAEYCFATLSTYFVGDSVKQWSIVISLMLFSMGLGSRLTRLFKKNLFQIFVLTELCLSIIVSFSAVSTYYLVAHIEYIGIYIYFMAGLTGLLIGMELPLAVRLNNEFQELKFNVSNVLEKDYYGSLIGGLFFVFIGLPYLGLTYTPFILGAINLCTALVLLYIFKDKLSKRKITRLGFISTLILITIVFTSYSSENIILHGEQKQYKDKIVYQDQSMYQKIIVTQWKQDYWLYLNDNLQFSTFDEPLYHEVIVHPMMQLLNVPRNILILGGGDGCAVRELLKCDAIRQITLVDLDKKLTDLFTDHPEFSLINEKALSHEKVTVVNQDGFQFLEKTDQFYDLILVDLPDPKSVELSRLYSKEFYQLCQLKLTPRGGVITQAGSPYYTPKAFQCIELTMQNAGLNTLPLHNQILSMGEWGWVLGIKEEKSTEEIKSVLLNYKEDLVKTQWLNRESMQLITSFGKDFYRKGQRNTIEINSISNPVLYKYYEQGNWDTY